MYSVFRNHRILKVITIVLGLVVGSFLLTPAINLAEGRKIEASSLLGNYAYDASHQVILYNPSVGKMISGDVTTQFFYTYEEGLLTCSGESLSWDMRALGDGNLLNCYDGHYLYKGE